MEQLKRTGIEINYRKIPYDRQNTQGIQSSSKNDVERFKWAFLVFNLENETLIIFCFHLVCGLGEEGLSIFIDVTLTGFPRAREMMKHFGIPYFNFDYSVQSFVRLMEIYLKERKALDAVLILQDAISADQALYNFIMKSSLRIILLDQLPSNAAQRLKTLRPTPNYYAIIADTVNMEKIFRNVSANLMMKRP